MVSPLTFTYSSVDRLAETHLLLWSIATTCWTRICQTDTHRRPDPNKKLDNAENQNDHGERHLFVIVHFLVSSPTVRAILSKCYAVADKDYSTKHGWGDGEPHEDTSLRVKRKKNRSKCGVIMSTFSKEKAGLFEFSLCGGGGDPLYPTG